MQQPHQSRIRKAFRQAMQWIRQSFRKQPDPPVDPYADPYAYVTAPKKPRPSNRSAAAVAELPEE
jgi:hypothetical protein